MREIFSSKISSRTSGMKKLFSCTKFLVFSNEVFGLIDKIIFLKSSFFDELKSSKGLSRSVRMSSIINRKVLFSFFDEVRNLNWDKFK